MTTVVDLEVSGLAGRKGKLAVELNSDVNIFFGLNGTGKTSLLRIVHSAIRDDSSLLVDVPFASARVGIFSRDNNVVYQRYLQNGQAAWSTETWTMMRFFTRNRNLHTPLAWFDVGRWSASVSAYLHGPHHLKPRRQSL